MDDDALERALAALPLEEPPAGLHARIMNATVYAPVARVSASPLLAWEITAVGVLAAVAVWLTWLVVTMPLFAERAQHAIQSFLTLGSVSSMTTLLWIAVGVSAAFWISQITVPQSRVRAQ